MSILVKQKEARWGLAPFTAGSMVSLNSLSTNWQMNGHICFTVWKPKRLQPSPDLAVRGRRAIWFPIVYVLHINTAEGRDQCSASTDFCNVKQKGLKSNVKRWFIRCYDTAVRRSSTLELCDLGGTFNPQECIRPHLTALILKAWRFKKRKKGTKDLKWTDELCWTLCGSFRETRPICCCLHHGLL